MNEKNELEREIRRIGKELNLLSAKKESILDHINESRKELNFIQDIIDDLSRDIIRVMGELSKIKE